MFFFRALLLAPTPLSVDGVLKAALSLIDDVAISDSIAPTFNDNDSVDNNDPKNYDQPSFEAPAGLEDIWNRLRIAVLDPLRDWTIYAKLGVERTDGVLLYGPSGTVSIVAKQMQIKNQIQIANEIYSNTNNAKPHQSNPSQTLSLPSHT